LRTNPLTIRDLAAEMGCHFYDLLSFIDNAADGILEDFGPFPRSC